MAATLDNVAGRTFDYIVIGGGTTGLTLAARLSEDPTATVCVLEAGSSNLDNPAILGLATYGSHLGQKQCDWGHASTKQKLLGDRIMPLSRGLGLGGSSGINFMAWTKPPAEEVNDWERLGNPGWNWKNYAKYAARVERFVEPVPEQREKLGVPSGAGTQGALAISYPRTLSEADFLMWEALKRSGIPEAPLPYGGNPTGCYQALNSHDPATGTRSYATTGYYMPNKDRKNLTVLTGAVVTRVISGTTAHGTFVATDVEFVYEDQNYTSHVGKEAIISAGAFKSPQLLELSGIGRRDVLESAGVEVKVELPGVGENLQEHMFGSLGWLLKPEHNFLCFDLLKHPKTLAEQKELYKKLQGVLTMGAFNFTFVPLETLSPSTADTVYNKAKAHIEALDPKTTPPGLLEQYKIQLERLEPGKGQSGPACEIIGFPGLMAPIETQEGRTYISWMYGTNHALSRGRVHITSKDPKAEPEIDPNYFDHEADLDVLVEVAKFCRKLVTVEPLKNLIDKELLPGPDVETDEQFRDFVKNTYSSTWHTCGTCSMLPREKGGVVDPSLKVYGTENLRVADLSIIPLHFAAHTQATAYVIGEQAADIIKGKFTP